MNVFARETFLSKRSKLPYILWFKSDGIINTQTVKKIY